MGRVWEALLVAGTAVVLCATTASAGGAALLTPHQASRAVAAARARPADTALNGWTASVLPLLPGYSVSTALPSTGDIACLRSGTCVTGVSFNGVPGGEIVTGSGTSWQAVKPPLPANSYAGAGYVDAVGCGTTTCVAVGSYDATSGSGLLVETGSGTTWTPDEPPEPAPEGLSAVACYTKCTAIGQGLHLESGSGTDWTASVAPQPSKSDVNAVLTSIACAPATCVAAGGYDNAQGNSLGLLEVETGGKWTAVKAPLPPDADRDPYVDLDAIACSPSGDCTVVGTFWANSPPTTQGVFITGSGTHWTATQIPLPPGKSSVYEMDDVACSSARSCTAVGGDVDNSGFEHILLTTQAGPDLVSANGPVPSDNAEPGASTQGQIACVSALLCVTSGGYTNKAGNYVPFVTSGSGTKWTSRAAPVPSQAPSDPDASLIYLACARSCVAVGNYDGEIPYLSAGTPASALPGTGSLRLAALGDSYSSGNGTTGATGDCVRSFQAWPELLPGSVGSSAISPVTMLACSGADSNGTRVHPKQDLPAQIAELRKLKPAPGIVTLTIGGDDGRSEHVGFFNVLVACALSDSACAVAVSSELKWIRKSEHALLHQDYSAIRAADPSATVVVVGYPKIFPDAKCGVFTKAEGQVLNSLTSTLDSTIASAAAKVPGVKYVNAAAAFAGHQLCTAHPWVVAPLHSTSKTDWMHPDNAGQQALSKVVADFIATEL